MILCIVGRPQKVGTDIYGSFLLLGYLAMTQSSYNNNVYLMLIDSYFYGYECSTVCVYVHHMCVWCLWRQEGIPKTGVMSG